MEHRLQDMATTGLHPMAVRTAPSYPFSQPYTLAPTYSSQSSAQFTDQTVNPNIPTEKRQATELGGNIRFFNNRLEFDVTHFYYKNTGIVNLGTSSSSGYSSYKTNGNIYTNQGWEFVVTGHAFLNPQGWSWTISQAISEALKKMGK